MQVESYCLDFVFNFIKRAALFEPHTMSSTRTCIFFQVFAITELGGLDAITSSNQLSE